MKTTPPTWCTTQALACSKAFSFLGGRSEFLYVYRFLIRFLTH